LPQTYYEILGVSELATSGEIEAAFKSKASEVHPDRVSPGSPYLRNIAAEAFKNLSEAKAVLLDAGKRQKYDAELTYSRGSSASPPAGPAAAGPDDSAFRTAAPAAEPARTRPTPRPFLWLLNTPSGLVALGVACGALLLTGGIALQRASFVPATPQITPAANSPEKNPGSADPCKSEAASNCTNGSTVTQPAGMSESSQTKKKSRATPNARPSESNTRPPARSSNASTSRTISLWRASEPPDLSALSSSERQAIESACSYAKLMESPDAYNGCLAKELALRSRRDGKQN
jgi:curved DNA-binding protein CbpA